MKSTKFIVLENNQTLLESLIENVINLMVAALFVYISRDSTVWSLISGGIFILLLVAQVAKLTGRHKKFKTKDELIAWAKTLPE